jgi:hypothetical protein
MIVSLLVPLQVLALAAPAPRSDSALVQATRYEYSTESKSEGPAPMQMSGDYAVTYTDRNSRIDVLKTTGPQAPGKQSAGSFTLNTDQHVYSVDPEKREYSEVSPENLKAQTGELMKTMKGMQLKFSDFKFDVTDLGDGEPLLGHPTTRQKIKQRMTVTAVIVGDTVAITVESTQETWKAKDLRGAIDPTIAADTSLSSPFGDIIPQADIDKLKAAMEKVPKGLPLKSVTHTTSYLGPMEINVTMNMVVTKIERVSVPVSLFELPSGYKLVDLPRIKPQ